MPVASNAPRVQLHLAHDLGGGAERWLLDFLAADEARENRVLRGITHDANAATGVALYDARDLSRPLRVWTFREPIAAVATHHAEYASALHEVIEAEGIGGLIVSSLIGHSLDALSTGLPTLVVSHDYFPYCPAINLYFDEVCETCDAPRLERCAEGNRRFDPFAGFSADMRKAARERFVELALQPGVTLVAPTESVVRNLRRLEPRFERASFATVPHGAGTALMPARSGPADPAGRLRIVVLGQLSAAKGVDLLRQAMPRITRFADVTLLGAGALGDLFDGMPHVRVVRRYEREDLPTHLRHLDPHLGLLPSIVSETFSYALSELFMLGVPVVATRLGAFDDRIQEGRNGWLFAPDADALVTLLQRLDGDRESIARATEQLRLWRPRMATEMVADYHRLLPLAEPATSRPIVPPATTPASHEVLASQAATLASMWRELKQMHLQASVTRERYEAERADLQRRAADLEHQVDLLTKRVQEDESLVTSRTRELEEVVATLRIHEATIRSIYGSTSWRLLGPFRRLGRAATRVRLLGACMAGVFRDPQPLPVKVRRLWIAGRNGGALGLKTALLAYRSVEGPATAWSHYRRTLQAEVLPALRKQAAAMAERPRISIVMCTYNTRPEMLRAALDSVIAQVYPEWELCVADDSSPQPHVLRILREYAARDARIRVLPGETNGGVAHASNRALATVTGEYVVLMDHDDALEEQALFRFAQSIVTDAPDILYSDEVLAAEDGETALEIVYRPAFSPELLRAHPYIVHLAGFRTALLREIGGFDESLRISQDYDLMLRATERARRVVHVPEPLYRWRTHAASAGHKLIGQVGATSTAILQRHLERTAPGATAAEGYGFNFYDIRYPLREGLRVAVIIPTKNHGTLVRQCVESLRATVKQVPIDIIVVDHESDDPATVHYLETAREIDRVFRFEGPFNFSTINNFAVARLERDYSHVLFCNNDIEAMHEGWLERMLELGQQPDVGIVGAKLLYGDRRTIQHAGVCLGAFGRAEHYGKFVKLPEDRVEGGYYGTFAVSREMSAVTAACLLTRLDVFREVGGFDEELAVGFGDVDLCLRVGERGYRIVQCSAATLVHHESITRGRNNLHPVDSALFDEKWQAAMDRGDPYFNPGFSPTHHNWGPRNPLHCAIDIRRRVVTLDREHARQAITFSEN